MKPLDGKRLLHLGGARFQTPCLERARSLGCEVILADHDPDAPGRAYANVFEQVSTRDVEGVFALAIAHAVDGVMTYASDSSVETAAVVAQRLGLPGNPPEAAATIRNKDLFRQFQSAHGLPRPEFFVATTAAEAFSGVRDLRFPLVVKPVDSAGTKGQSVIHGLAEVGRALTVALEQSKVKRAIFEEYIHTDMMELDGDVWFEDGRLAFRHYGHNWFLRDRISNVPSGEIFPGFLDEALTSHLDAQLSSVIRMLGLRSGCFNFDALARNGTVHIVDIGLRNGGNFVPDAIELSTGFDLTAASIHAALGVPFGGRIRGEPARHVATYLAGSRFAGRYTGLEIGRELEPNVVGVRPFLAEGERIERYERADRAAAILFLQFPDAETLRDRIDRIEELVRVKVVPTGAEMAPGAARPRRGQLIAGEFKTFPQLVSPFLTEKLAEAEHAGDQTVLRVLSRQYLESSDEGHVRVVEGMKHYEAAEDVRWEGEKLVAVERLYRRVMLFEPLYQCAANCRFCLRRNYGLFNQTTADIQRIARYIGRAPGHEVLREVLVTGGDPFLAPDKVRTFLEAIAEQAPQIRIARIATRLPIHDPDRVDGAILDVIGAKYPFRIEVATQVNHASELFPEVRSAYARVRDLVPVYNQTVLLRGVNDTLPELVDVCEGLRDLAIENHYLFHCVPIGGLNAMRTPLASSIALARQLSGSGRIGGRAKPQFCLMTSVGKITPYEGTIIDYRDHSYLLRSEYSYAERMEWNPSWSLPQNAFVAEDGKLCVWYEDAVVEPVEPIESRDRRQEAPVSPEPNLGAM